MSVRNTIDLPPGHHPRSVAVRAGVADVFVVAPSGPLVPLCTVSAGGVIPAARSHTHLRVVPRLDCTLEYLDPTHHPDNADGIATFTATLVDRLGSFAEPFADAHPDHVPALLAEQVPDYLNHTAQQVADQRAQRSRLDVNDRREEYSRLAQSVTKSSGNFQPEDNDPLIVALRRIGHHEGFGVTPPVHRGSGLLPPQQLLGVAHASGFRYRRIRLATGWDKPRSSSFLAFDDDAEQTPVALIPTSRGYLAYRGTDRKPIPVDPSAISHLGGYAYEVTPPLSRGRAATWRDLVRVGVDKSGGSWLIICSMAALVALLGLLTPILTQYVLGEAVPRDSYSLLMQAGIALVVVAFVSGILSMVMFFTVSRVTQRATARVQPALWDRMLSMPASFFRGFSSGDLSVRVMAADALQQLVSTQVIGATLAAVFSLVNLVLMFIYSTTLGLIGLAFITLTFIVLIVAIWHMQRLYTISVNAQLDSTSWVVQLLSGIGKIRLAGAESRMELPYLEKVREQMVALARMTKVMGRVNGWFLLVVPLATGAFYLVIAAQFTAAGPPISAATYLAFTAAFATVFGAVNGLISVLSPIASAGPILRLLHPILVAEPESAQHRSDPGPIGGAIEFRNVVFRYEPESPIVLDRLSFKVSAGEFVALVGPSGSGKSSTVRLILGFEDAEDGQVLIDGRDLAELDLDIVRGQMGVVIQDGQITRASILNNILGVTGGAEEDAWRAAEAANLDDDIRAMPMKMQTMVDPQIVSGGQAQRILLARALVRNPRIVILDEATSALDNESQERVTQAMNALGATRIVVAHRLSTIQSADRIIVIKDGKVVQEGSYEDLVQVDGEFANLARRQTV
jgi:NHLM bacteriocin system ABC transporter ATP-binding protein